MVDLHNIQGHILVEFGQPYRNHVVLAFGDAQHARAWVAQATAAVRRSSSAALQTASGAAGPHQHLAFSHRGLRSLGVPAADLRAFPAWFAGGMASRSGEIGDEGAAAPERWGPPFERGAGQVDALLIVAARCCADLDAGMAAVCGTAAFARGVAKFAVLEGRERADAPGCEHFGFRDGLSQPGVRGIDAPAPGQALLWPGEFVLGHPRQKNTAKPGVPGPNPDPGPLSAAGPAWTKDGSFLVLRRLQQDVAGFDAQVQALAGAYGLGAELVEARLMGRAKSGAWLKDLQAPAQGLHCPLAAHTEKVYPRDERMFRNAPDLASEIETHRLLRRGIPYGPSFDAARPESAAEPRGLLFVAFQSDIEAQFELVQNKWMNHRMFPPAAPGGVAPGQDPIAATSAAGPFRWREGEASRELAHFVTMTGGEYFFSPSIAALERLSPMR